MGELPPEAPQLDRGRLVLSLIWRKRRGGEQDADNGLLVSAVGCDGCHDGVGRYVIMLI